MTTIAMAHNLLPPTGKASEVLNEFFTKAH
jgi:hypothetical protein